MKTTILALELHSDIGHFGRTHIGERPWNGSGGFPACDTSATRGSATSGARAARATAPRPGCWVKCKDGCSPCGDPWVIAGWWYLSWPESSPWVSHRLLTMVSTQWSFIANHDCPLPLWLPHIIMYRANDYPSPEWLCSTNHYETLSTMIVNHFDSSTATYSKWWLLITYEWASARINIINRQAIHGHLFT